VRQHLAEAVADFLSFSGNTCDPLNELKGFAPRDWKRTLTWLHDAGLALYFLQKLKDANATDLLPKSALSRLEQNLAANQRRVAFMSRQFDSINQKFESAGVKYVAVKGFSLVLKFCPDASLRHQSDFDYLVDRQSLTGAQQVLMNAGYLLNKHTANEFVFLMPSAGIPPAADEQYEAHAPYAVELRLAFWDFDSHGVFFREPEFSVHNTKTHRWRGLTFRALPDEDAFLLQVIHAFNHLLAGWVRMSWLYEIGYFLNHQALDTLLWARIEHRVESDPLLREIVAVVTELSAQFFGARLPSKFGVWAENLRPAVRIWIQNYARTWAFKNQLGQVSLFSVDKFVLFLHQQYLSDARARRHLIRMRLLPLEQLFRRAHSITNPFSTNPRGRTRQLERALIRLVFHVTGGLRYLWEIPRWRRLNKGTARPAFQISAIRQQ
jgi:Uncharacterised nucleotidyltransferase